MKCKVIVHKRAAKYLQSLSAVQKDRIKQSIKKLEDGDNGDGHT